MRMNTVKSSMIAALGVVVLLSGTVSAAGTDAPSAARGLIERLVGARSDAFVLETIDAENGSDVFELQSREGKIVIAGSSGVAIASGWNWYLKYYCHRQASLWGDNITLPDTLPPVLEKIRRVSPFQYRYNPTDKPIKTEMAFQRISHAVGNVI